MTAQAADFDSLAFRHALGRFATGVTVITTTHPHTGEPIGLTVSSFNSVSIEPPLVLWSLQNSSVLLEVFKQVSRYNIHILSADQINLAMRFSRGPQSDRFKHLDYTLNQHGIPKLVENCTAAWFECHNSRRYPEGDHMILVGQVERCSAGDLMPLVFHAGSFELTPMSNQFSKPSVGMTQSAPKDSS